MKQSSRKNATMVTTTDAVQSKRGTRAKRVPRETTVKETRRGKAARRAEEPTSEPLEIVSVGIDLGDRFSDVAVLDEEGTIVLESRIPTNEASLRGMLEAIAPCTVAIEVGTLSPWVSRLITACGHTALVANPRKVKLISENKRKNNRVDAELLARLARADETLLHPIQHRGEEAQSDLAVLRARDLLVRVRTTLISHVRGAVKSVGKKLPRCSAEAFVNKCRSEIPEILHDALDQQLEQIESINRGIDGYDKAIAALAKRYPAVEKLVRVRGVGLLTAMAFILVLEDPGRFRSSRAVGAYMGLVPGSDDTGDHHVQKRVTKEGDGLLRKLLVNAAHYTLGPFGTDSDPRRHGEAIAERGGKNGKKRAVVAVARKLAVLLHRLWVSDIAYDPLYNARHRDEPLAA